MVFKKSSQKLSRSELIPGAIPLLTGPTACGKSALALSLKKQVPQLEIINADSIAIYQGFDIGASKPTLVEREQVPHHLFDICDPNERYSAGKFARAVNTILHETLDRGAAPLIVGGTGFYLKALTHGMWDVPGPSPEIRAQLDPLSTEELAALYRSWIEKAPSRIQMQNPLPADRYRIIRSLEILELTQKFPSEHEAAPKEKLCDFEFQLFVMDRNVEELEAQIRTRTQAMLQQGLVDEVRKLLQQFPESPALKSVGYRQVVDFIEGTFPEGRKLRPGVDGLKDEIELGTRQLIKTQRTWFRGQTPDNARHYMLPEDEASLRNDLVLALSQIENVNSQPHEAN